MSIIPLKMILDIKSENLLVLRLGHGFRFFFSGLCLFILFFVFTDENSTALNTGPYLIVLLSFISSLYYETWFFDKASKKVIHRHGFILVYKQSVIHMKDIEVFKITHFKTGDANTGAKNKRFLVSRYIKFSLLSNKGKAYVIEVLKKSALSDLESKAEQVSHFCGIPLEVEDI